MMRSSSVAGHLDMGKQVIELIEKLQQSLEQTVAVLSALSDAELDEVSPHPCAMGGSINDLLAHNIDHEKMHTGQIYTQRYNLRKMQFSRVDRLVAETVRARTELVTALIGLPDDALDAKTPQDQWSIREMLEHTIYWERHSMDDLARSQLKGRVPEELGSTAFVVVDPVRGELVNVESDVT